MTYRERLLAWESNFGRTAGWDVELDGRKIVFLDDAKWEDMFWVSYRVATNDALVAGRLQDNSFWLEGDAKRFVYRSRTTGTAAPLAFPGPLIAPGRIMMRALYVSPGPRLPWDFVVLGLRKLWRLSRAAAPCN